MSTINWAGLCRTWYRPGGQIMEIRFCALQLQNSDFSLFKKKNRGSAGDPRKLNDDLLSLRATAEISWHTPRRKSPNSVEESVAHRLALPPFRKSHQCSLLPIRPGALTLERIRSKLLGIYVSSLLLHWIGRKLAESTKSSVSRVAPLQIALCVNAPVVAVALQFAAPMRKGRR